MDDIVFSLPFLLDSLNEQLRQHWAKRSKAKWDLSQEVMAAVGGPAHYPRPPWRKVRVTVNRCSAGRLDLDSLAGSVKPLLDVLCVESPIHPSGLGFFEDDRPDLLDLRVTQSSAPPGSGSTLVRIECLDVRSAARG